MEVDTPAAAIPNGAFNYIVSALKPAGVVTSLVGNFVDASTLNLIVGCVFFWMRVLCPSPKKKKNPHKCVLARKLLLYTYCSQKSHTH